MHALTDSDFFWFCECYRNRSSSQANIRVSSLITAYFNVISDYTVDSLFKNKTELFYAITIDYFLD